MKIPAFTPGSSLPPTPQQAAVYRVGWIKRRRRVSAACPVDSRYALNPPYKNIAPQAPGNSTRRDKIDPNNFFMETTPQTESSAHKRIALAGILLIALAAGVWVWRAKNAVNDTHATSAVHQVVSAPVMLADVSARLTANGTVTAVQTVE